MCEHDKSKTKQKLLQLETGAHTLDGEVYCPCCCVCLIGSPFSCFEPAARSFRPGITLQHQPHQLRASPRTSRPRTREDERSSSHSGPQAPMRTMRTSLRFTMPPMPSISCRSYPGPRSSGDGVRSCTRESSISDSTACECGGELDATAGKYDPW